jgi:hypothetical protein
MPPLHPNMSRFAEVLIQSNNCSTSTRVDPGARYFACIIWVVRRDLAARGVDEAGGGASTLKTATSASANARSEANVTGN